MKEITLPTNIQSSHSLAKQTRELGHSPKVHRWKLDKAALRMAFSMSFLSIIVMEIVMNATDFMITGGKARQDSVSCWLAFIPAAVAGFLTPLPITTTS